MRLKRRLAFDPPLHGPAEARAARVAGELGRLGFRHVTRAGTRVEFGDHVLRRLSLPEARHASRVISGSVQVDPHGTHADLEIRLPFGSLVIPAVVMAGIAAMDGPWLMRALPFVLLVMVCMHAWRGVVALVTAVGRGATAP